MQSRLEKIIHGLKQATTLDDLNSVVVQTRDVLAVDHVVYHSVNGRGDQYAALTYDDRWVQRYIENDYARIDPVIRGCLFSFAPFDWRILDWSGRNVRAFLGEARHMGVGQQGFSIPIRGPNGQFAVLTANGESSDEAWQSLVETSTRHMLLLAHFLNEQAIVIERAGAPAQVPFPGLSPREIDALSYMAIGLSRVQAADKLHISEHTLRVYIEGARHKLGATNTTHAVARAVAMGLLSV